MSGWRAAERRQMARYGAHIEPIQRNENREPAGAGYTIAHAGRQIRLGPVAFWIAVGTVVIMAGWSVTTATYFAFRDDLLKGLIARQAEQQYAYEDRIAELRARIDRTTSRQLLDQEQFEQKLDDLVRRQATLESRAAALVGIIDTPTGSLRSSRPGADALTVPQARDRRSSLEHELAPRRPQERQGRRCQHQAFADRNFARSRRSPPDDRAGGDAGTLRRQGAQAARRIGGTRA